MIFVKKLEQITGVIEKSSKIKFIRLQKFNPNDQRKGTFYLRGGSFFLF